MGILRHKGYIERDYAEVPEFSAYNEFAGDRIPRSEWKERIEHLNEIGGQPYHWHKRFGKIKNQKSTNYCWCYGTVAALETSMIMSGVSGIELNAHAVAYKGKHGANRGGYGVEACRYIEQYGVPEIRVMPEFTRTTKWSAEVQENAKLNGLADFSELGRSDFEGVVSALIGPRPSPVTLAFSWWRHLVCGLGVAIKGDDFGLIIANSWGTRYSAGGLSGGYGIIWGRKAVPFESVVARFADARWEPKNA